MGRWARAVAALKNSSALWSPGRNRGGFEESLFLFEDPFVFCCSINSATIIMPLGALNTFAILLNNNTFFTFHLVFSVAYMAALFFKQPQIESFYFPHILWFTDSYTSLPCIHENNSLLKHSVYFVPASVSLGCLLSFLRIQVSAGSLLFFPFFSPPPFWAFYDFVLSFGNLAVDRFLEHFCLSVNCPSQMSQGHWILIRCNLQKKAQGQE